MNSKLIYVLLIFVMFFSVSSIAQQQCARTDAGISEKKWNPGDQSDAAKVYPDVVYADDDQCSDKSFFKRDRALIFDLSEWFKYLDNNGIEFDPNNIVISADPEVQSGLDSLQESYSDTGNKVINYLGNEYCGNQVRVCAGGSVDATNDYQSAL